VKTAISIPDELFERAERQRLVTSMSRSEFYASAIRSLLDRIESDDLTTHINAALELIAVTDDDRDEQRILLDYGRRRRAKLDRGEDW
jgi:metal-responsive CopG/Arc/MetJ family transcriptional regulator